MSFEIHPTCRVHPSAKINVRNGFLGRNSIVNENAVIEGSLIEIGREAFIDRYATIGGGSCFDSCAFLRAQDWLHMGVNSQVNIARGVAIGNEVGIGIDSKIFTHGAYLDCLNIGAPVQWGGVEIGDNVWLPNAWVNPGVKIGSNVVIGARSLITKDIPTGALAAGSPAQILKENAFPRELTEEAVDAILASLLSQLEMRIKDASVTAKISRQSGLRVIVLQSDLGTTSFDLAKKVISGVASEASFLIRDQLRRNGIRFRYEDVSGFWNEWGK
jgi:acetyltransferase-like isoleucine patch superfamily enzyme